MKKELRKILVMCLIAVMSVTLVFQTQEKVIINATSYYYTNDSSVVIVDKNKIKSLSWGKIKRNYKKAKTKVTISNLKERKYTFHYVNKKNIRKKVVVICDKTKPVISGVKNGKEYTKAVQVSVNDAFSGISSIYVNDEKKSTNSFILSDLGEYKITAKDKCGNKKTVVITIVLDANEDEIHAPSEQGSLEKDEKDNSTATPVVSTEAPVVSTATPVVATAVPTATPVVATAVPTATPVVATAVPTATPVVATAVPTATPHVHKSVQKTVQEATASTDRTYKIVCEECGMELEGGEIFVDYNTHTDKVQPHSWTSVLSGEYTGRVMYDTGEYDGQLYSGASFGPSYMQTGNMTLDNKSEISWAYHSQMQNTAGLLQDLKFVIGMADNKVCSSGVKCCQILYTSEASETALANRNTVDKAKELIMNYKQFGKMDLGAQNVSNAAEIDIKIDSVSGYCFYYILLEDNAGNVTLCTTPSFWV